MSEKCRKLFPFFDPKWVTSIWRAPWMAQQKHLSHMLIWSLSQPRCSDLSCPWARFFLGGGESKQADGHCLSMNNARLDWAKPSLAETYKEFGVLTADSSSRSGRRQDICWVPSLGGWLPAQGMARSWQANTTAGSQAGCSGQGARTGLACSKLDTSQSMQLLLAVIKGGDQSYKIWRPLQTASGRSQAPKWLLDRGEVILTHDKCLCSIYLALASSDISLEVKGNHLFCAVQKGVEKSPSVLQALLRWAESLIKTQWKARCLQEDSETTWEWGSLQPLLPLTVCLSGDFFLLGGNLSLWKSWGLLNGRISNYRLKCYNHSLSPTSPNSKIQLVWSAASHTLCIPKLQMDHSSAIWNAVSLRDQRENRICV